MTFKILKEEHIDNKTILTFVAPHFVYDCQNESGCINYLLILHCFPN